METSKRVGFRPDVVVEVPSWKEDTRRRNFSGLNALNTARPRGEPDMLAANDHHDRGLGHRGNQEDEEVIVLEEQERPGEGGPRVVRVPRAPTQKEIEAHEATHIPHAEWCDFCMAGRGRNKPHRKKSRKAQFCIGEADGGV